MYRLPCNETKASFLPSLLGLLPSSGFSECSAQFVSLSLSVLEPLSQSVRFGKRNYELREGRIYLQRLRTAKSTHGRDGEASGGHARNWQFCNRKSKAHLIASMCYGLPFLLGERERERERERECNTFLVFRLMLPHRAKINAQYFTHAACPKCLTRFGPTSSHPAGLPFLYRDSKKGGQRACAT